MVDFFEEVVSMESGLEGRNNSREYGCAQGLHVVSMESGLEGRNNWTGICGVRCIYGYVSMESGLEGRNNKVIADKIFGWRR